MKKQTILENWFLDANKKCYESLHRNFDGG